MASLPAALFHSAVRDGSWSESDPRKRCGLQVLGDAGKQDQAELEQEVNVQGSNTTETHYRK